ncbi:MAG: DsbA family protein [Pseudomonadota bacterium]
MQTSTLIYVHDPMCSWCWGFRPTLDAVTESVPNEIVVTRLVGGLAPDSDDPMPVSMQDYLQQTWRAIQHRIPGTEFNFDFWTHCEPRRSTYPACRAVIAARLIDRDSEARMIDGIQRAYYLKAQNPSDIDTLVSVAESINLDAERFRELLQSDKVERLLQDELTLVRRMGVGGFPSLVLQVGNSVSGIAMRYGDPAAITADIIRRI